MLEKICRYLILNRRLIQNLPYHTKPFVVKYKLDMRLLKVYDEDSTSYSYR